MLVLRDSILIFSFLFAGFRDLKKGKFGKVISIEEKGGNKEIFCFQLRFGWLISKPETALLF